ncbi:MAG: 50S ribosomal protein L6 [Minisyncoccia bacterium]
MSKVGKQLINIPNDLKVEIKEDNILFEKDNKKLIVPLLKGIKANFENNVLSFSLIENNKQTRSNWGTLAALCKNAVIGLTQGYQKTLVLEGIGYKVQKEGEGIVLSLGFSHPVKYFPPAGIILEVEKNNTIHIKGYDKQLVGQVAAEIRSFKKPEPYKGKGIRYIDEVVRRKEGKKSASGK